MNSTCAICGQIFTARHSYGLCKFCFSYDRAREYDRLQSAIRAAKHKGVSPITLQLTELLSTLSDFNSTCSFCNEYNYSVIEMISPNKGLTYDNVVPACRACSKRRNEGYETAEYRVKQYLDIERVQHNITHNEECEELA